jgi:tetratricopeptide (TPR) repeat protein
MQRKLETANDYNRKGMEYCLNKSKPDKAYACFTQAILLDPAYAAPYYNRAYVNLQQDNHKEAIVDLTRALELKPGLARAYYNRGMAYKALGQSEKANADFTLAFEFDPTDINIAASLQFTSLENKAISTQQTLTTSTNPNLLFNINKQKNGDDYRYFDNCIKRVVLDLKSQQEELDDKHYDRVIESTISNEILLLSTLIKMRNNQAISKDEHIYLKWSPLFKEDKRIENYANIAKKSALTTEDNDYLTGDAKRNPFDVYIDDIATCLKYFETELEEKPYIGKPPVHIAPEWVEHFIELEQGIRAQIFRLNSLIKIKNDEPISKEEHDRLMLMDWLKEDERLKNYPKIEKSLEDTKTMGMKKSS